MLLLRGSILLGIKMQMVAGDDSMTGVLKASLNLSTVLFQYLHVLGGGFIYF